MSSPTVDRRFGLVGNAAIKAPVVVVATTNITLSGEQTIDGYDVQAVNAAGVADRVLCIGQDDTAENGIYDVNTSAWTRSYDANGQYDLRKGSTVFVTDGTANGGRYYQLVTDDPITVGTTEMEWTTVLDEINAGAAAASASASAAATSASNAHTDAVAAATARTGAETAESNAETAQALAEAASLLAMGGANLYSTTAQGLAATSDGQVFFLRTADLYTYTAYYNDSGSESLLGTVYLASGERFQQDAGTAVHGVFADSNGDALGYWDDDGLWYWSESQGDYVLMVPQPAEVESNSAADLAVAVETSDKIPLAGITPTGRLVLHGQGDLLAQLASSDFITGLRYEANSETGKARFFYDKASHVLRERVRIEKVACYSNESSGTSFARMPALLVLSQDDTAVSGLIFFSQRKSFYTSGENAQRGCCRSFDIDLEAGTITLGTIVVIYQRSEWGNATPGGWVTNPVPFVEGAGGSHPGRVHVLFNTFDSPTGILDNGEYYIVDCYSDDDGANWSAPTAVMTKNQVFDTLTGGTGGVTGALTQNQSTKRYGPITSTGNTIVRLTEGAHAGRLVVSLNVLNDGTGAYVARWWQGAMYSDDEGATWTRGTLYFAVTNQNEAQIVETSGGGLLRLVRDDTNDGVTNQLRRGQAESTDGGATWSYIGVNTTAKFMNCSGSLARYPFNAATGFEKTIAGGPTTPTFGQRNKMRILFSYDGGDTFVGEASPLKDIMGVGYQYAVVLDSGALLLAYETFNGLGAINTEDSVCLLYANEAELFSSAALF